MKTLNPLISVLLVSAFFVALDGFLMKILWSWFVVPVFAVSPVTWAQAYGLVLICNSFFGRHKGSTEGRQEDLATLLISKLSYFLAVLLMASVIYSFFI